MRARWTPEQVGHEARAAQKLIGYETLEARERVRHEARGAHNLADSNSSHKIQ